MIIKTWRDPYDAGFNTIKPKEIELNKGLTVLVGCNGAGKTTLIQNIEEHCNINKIPVHLFNNLSNGGSNNVLASVLCGFTELECDDLSLGVTMWSSSEGEAIKMNLARQSTLYKEFLQSGYFKDRMFNLDNIFFENKEVTDNRRVLLYDATDSGLSIDNIIEIKMMFCNILKASEELGLETYIIISANEYELCNDESCFDVNEGEYITFDNYEEYRKFICNSRLRKEKRIEKQAKWQEKNKQKEIDKYNKLIDNTIERLKKIKINKETQNKRMFYKVKDILEEINDFNRKSRFNEFKRLDVWKLSNKPVNEIIKEIEQRKI